MAFGPGLAGINASFFVNGTGEHRQYFGPFFEFKFHQGADGAVIGGLRIH